MTHKRRIRALECSIFEAEIARLEAFFASFSEADLDEIILGFKVGLSSPILERYVAGFNTFSDAVLEARERRVIVELRRRGMSEAEISKIMGER